MTTEIQMVYQVRSGTQGVWMRGARVVRETAQTLLLERVEGVEAGGLVWAHGDGTSRSKKEHLGDLAASPEEAWEKFIARSLKSIREHEEAISRTRQHIASAEAARDAVEVRDA